MQSMEIQIVTFVKKHVSCKAGTIGVVITLLKLHCEAFKEYEDKKKWGKRPSTSSEQSNSKQAKIYIFFQVPTATLQKALVEAIVEFLAESNAAFRVVDLESFKNMFSCINNKVAVKSREFYSKLVTTKVNEIRTDLLSIVESLKDILMTVIFTSDLWTSVNNEPFISLTMHFISRYWKLYRFVPYVKPFPECHTGKKHSNVPEFYD